MITCLDFKRLATAVEGLGVEAPNGMTAVLESVNALREAVIGQPRNPVNVIRDTFKKAASDGQPISVKESRILCKNLVSEQLISSHLGGHLNALDHSTATLLQQLL